MHPSDSSAVLVPEPRIYKTNEWGATPARRVFPLTKPDAIIIHGTAGHHREIANPRDESREEAFRYARDIQAFHKAPPPRGRGWDDSGHDLLIVRNGMILAGRHGIVPALRSGHCVESAHCPRENHNPGIEFEHLGDEPLTDAQRISGVKAMAWIAFTCKLAPQAIYPHRKFFATECPTDSIAKSLPDFRTLVYRHLRGR